MRNISFIGSVPCLELPIIRSIPKRKRVEDASELGRLCKLVYACDPRTNLPSGDLQVLFSDNVNPDIRDWITRQLLQPVDFNSVSSFKQGQQLDDETILSCMRKRGESSHEYISRMDDYLRSINNKEG